MMQRRRVSSLTVTASLAMLMAAGCSDDPKTTNEASPGLKKRVCWEGAFEGEKVEKLLPDSDKVSFDVDPAFDLYGRKSSATCLINMDGNTKFTARGNREPSNDLDWSEWDTANPAPINVGDKGISWATKYSTGALAYFTCNRPDSLPAEDPDRPNAHNIIELELHAHDPKDPGAARKELLPLMKDFVAYAQRNLHCGDR